MNSRGDQRSALSLCLQMKALEVRGHVTCPRCVTDKSQTYTQGQLPVEAASCFQQTLDGCLFMPVSVAWALPPACGIDSTQKEHRLCSWIALKSRPHCLLALCLSKVLDHSVTQFCRKWLVIILTWWGCCELKQINPHKTLLIDTWEMLSNCYLSLSGYSEFILFMSLL